MTELTESAIGCLREYVETLRFLDYQRDMSRLTRKEVMVLTAASERLLASGKVGARPVTDQTLKRFYDNRAKRMDELLLEKLQFEASAYAQKRA
jgi:hypothetical protein